MKNYYQHDLITKQGKEIDETYENNQSNKP